MTEDKLKRGDKFESVARELTPRGTALVRHEGWGLEVDGLLPGERGLIRVEHLSRHRLHGHATLLERKSDHQARRSAPCIRHVTREGVCGGCPLMPLEESAQREAKASWVREHLALPLHHIDFDDRAFGYRHSAKRVIAGKAGELTFGSYRKGSHHVADMRGCLVDHPLLRETFDELAHVANEGATVVGHHAEHAPSGLRYAWAKTNGKEVLLTLVTGDESGIEAVKALAPHLARPTTLAWSYQAGPGNRMRGAETTILRGPATLAFAGRNFGPNSFMQPNPVVAARATRDLSRAADGTAISGRRAVDLYAGTGTTTADLRERFEVVEGCELEASSAALAEVEALSAEEFLTNMLAREQGAHTPQLIIANPPRAGLGPSVCEALGRVRSPRLHIMSCNPESLARDLRALESDYVVESVRGYDTLPQTPHLEVVAWLSRLGGSQPGERA